MPTGFIYVVPTVGNDYLQPSLRCVPTWFEGRIYFGPCKRPMRPRMMPGDYVFGISPSGVFPRRIVFTGRIAEKMTFGEAYEWFPKLRGPAGPIHVRPARMPASGYPDSLYEHIPGANHAESWRSDIRTPELDAFFVCEAAGECSGRWLGSAGPAVNGNILVLLKSCKVYGNAGLLSDTNAGATEEKPVRHGNLYTGLHLETNHPERLLELVCGLGQARSKVEGSALDQVSTVVPKRSWAKGRRKC